MMESWIIKQQQGWLAHLPPTEQRGWLERQVAKYLDFYNAEWINPFRQYLFVAWIYRMIFKALRGKV